MSYKKLHSERQTVSSRLFSRSKRQCQGTRGALEARQGQLKPGRARGRGKSLRHGPAKPTRGRSTSPNIRPKRRRCRPPCRRKRVKEQRQQRTKHQPTAHPLTWCTCASGNNRNGHGFSRLFACRTSRGDDRGSASKDLMRIAAPPNLRRTCKPLRWHCSFEKCRYVFILAD